MRALIIAIKRWSVWRQARKLAPGDMAWIGVGDSWFDLFGVKTGKPVDMLDWMRQFGIPLVNAALPGRTMKQELDEGLYRTALRAHPGPALVMVSLGGNDILEDPVALVADFARVVDACADRMRSLLGGLMLERAGNEERFLVFMHGYDYTRAEAEFPMFSGSLTSRFADLGLSDSEINSLMSRAIDRWNRHLAQIAREYRNVHYVDLRGTLSGTPYPDDIHPGPLGYMKLVVRFLDSIASILSA